MKNIIIILLLLFPVVCFPQNEITGIGKLKLGCDPSILKELGFKKIKKRKYKPIDYYPDRLTCFLILDHFLGDPVSEHVKEYWISLYQPSKYVRMREILLYFYDDFLYCISTPTARGLADAFNQKYGKCNTSLDYVENKYGEIDEFYTLTWDTGNENIKCIETYINNYDDYCFMIYYVDIYEKVKKENEILLNKKKLEDKLDRERELEKL